MKSVETNENRLYQKVTQSEEIVKFQTLCGVWQATDNELDISRFKFVAPHLSYCHPVHSLQP